MAITPATVTLVNNSSTGEPDQFFAFVTQLETAQALQAVPGIYDHSTVKRRHSYIVSGTIDMRYTSSDVINALKHAAGLSADVEVTVVASVASAGLRMRV